MTKALTTIYKFVRRTLGWILRPRLSYLRLREIFREGSGVTVRHDLPTNNLPFVTLSLAENEEELKQIVEIYKRNPSQMNITPRSMKRLLELLEGNAEFYLIRDVDGSNIGVFGWRTDRDMASYIAIDYEYRSRGFALAAQLAMNEIKKNQGILRSYAQVKRENKRMMNTYFSLGYLVDEEQSEKEYYTFYIDLNSQ